MKVFLVALFLCASVVAGTPDWSYEELGLAFGDNSKLTCLRQTLAAESVPEAKAFYAKYLPKIKSYLETEYTAAADAAGQAAVLENVIGAVANLKFGGIKVSGGNLSKYHEVFDKVAHDCYAINTATPNWAFEELAPRIDDHSQLNCLRYFLAAKSTPEAKAFYAKYLPKIKSYLETEYTAAADAAAKSAVLENTIASIGSLKFGGIKVSGPNGLEKFHEVFDEVATTCYGISA